MLESIIAVAVIAIIISAAIIYIVKEKKKGVKCIGCPYAKECASRKNNSSCNCGGKN